ncbi:MAG: tetratricopeptide repeat protein [Planctomycetota bacterium]
MSEPETSAPSNTNRGFFTRPGVLLWALGFSLSALVGLLLIVWAQSGQVRRAELELTATKATLTDAQKQISDVSTRLAKSAFDLGEAAKRETSLTAQVAAIQSEMAQQRKALTDALDAGEQRGKELVAAKLQAENARAEANAARTEANAAKAQARADETRYRRVRQFMETAFHPFAPVTVGPSDTTVVGVMRGAVDELESGALQDDLAARALVQTTIATVLLNSGEEVLAQQLFDDVLVDSRRRFTTDHEELADAIADAARARIATGDLASAASLADEALAMAKRISPGDSPLLADAIGVQAELAAAQGKLPEAARYAEEAASIWLRTAPKAWQTARELQKVADIYDRQRNYADALKVLQETLKIRRALHKGDHPDIAAALVSLGGVQQSLGQFDEAKKNLEDALSMQRNLHAGDHWAVADAMHNLASVKQNLGESIDAERLFRQSLAMKERIHKGDDPSVAAGLVSLALVEQSLGREDLAEPMLDRAIKMRQNLHEGDHEATARAFACRAWVRYDRREYDKAASDSKVAVEMLERLFPSGSAARAVAIALDARIAARMGDTDDARKKIEQAVTMVESMERPAGANTRVVLELRDEVMR